MALGGTIFLMPAPFAHSDIINSPKLAGELKEVSLGSLLPPNQIRLMEATFLSNEVVSPHQSRGKGGAGMQRRGSSGTDWTWTRSLTEQGNGLRAALTCPSCPPLPEQCEGADGPRPGTGVTALGPGYGPPEAGWPLSQRAGY